MDVTPLPPKGRPQLSGYGGGGFKVNDEFFPGSRLMLPESSHDWPVADAAGITLESLGAVAAQSAVLDLLIIGTGKGMALIRPDIRAFFREKGIAVEVMDTGAASRTYNILMAEGRRVAAALIAV